MKKLLYLSLLYVFPSLLFAEGLAPSTNDLSLSYLSTIFGANGVLHGTGTQVIGSMFGTFNSIVLCVAVVLLSYILLISILNTSHEGEFLGKKWSSMWVPLRTVAGIGLLLPKATGYTTLQALVIWVVIQGVGAADRLWDTALDYMNHNGAIVEPLQTLGPQAKANEANTNFLIGKAGDVLRSEACMLTVYNSLVHQYEGTGVIVPDFINSLRVTGKGPDGANTGLPINPLKDKGGFITFPGKLSGAFSSLEGACGNMSWNYVGSNGSTPMDSSEQLAANDSASIAARQMTLDLLPVAQGVANQLAPPLQVTAPLVQLEATQSIFQPNVLVAASDDYFGIIKPMLKSLADEATKRYKQFINTAKDQGWILSGSYYYNMARLNQSIKNNTGKAVVDKVLTNFSPAYETGGFRLINDNNVITNLKNNLMSSGGVIGTYVTTEKAKAAARSDATVEPDSSLPEHPANVNAIGKIVSTVLNAIFPRVQDFQKTLSDNINRKNMDPIFALASVGDGLVSMVEQVWVALLAAMTALGIAGIATGFASGFWTAGAAVNVMLAITNLLIVVMPLITIWMGVNFVLGSVLSYYVPLIPFFIFTFGAITWFAVVIEAVLAAPLVALGITHPDGHDFLGKAEQSVMLLLSVFLRPVLMIFGFIFGIILSYIALSLFNRGFGVAVQFLTEYNGDIFAIVYQTAMMAIYTAAVLAIINRSFSMIYEVPNKVLRWIGGPQDSGHEESMLQGIRGQHDRDVGQVAQQMPTGQGVNESSAGGMQLGRRLRELKQTKADAHPSNSPSEEGGGES